MPSEQEAGSVLLRGPACPSGADPAVPRTLARQPAPAGVHGLTGQREEPVGVLAGPVKGRSSGWS